MEEGNVLDKSLNSAAAFVEGGVQEPCEDACSICLESFSDNDPSTVTSCKHEFHLQCILEWCQRSSQCPMCWQLIRFKDSTSQELLDVVEKEKNIRMNPPINTTIFHHPTLGDFELQHLPISGSESELEERIIQHLAAAAAMGRARHLARRESQRNRSSSQSQSQSRPQFLVFSSHANNVTSGSNAPFITVPEDSAQITARPSSAQADHVVNETRTSSTNSEDIAGPSDSQSLPETLKSRLSALSTRYKDSITKSTRGWKERIFTRNSSNPEQVSVSRMMDHLHLSTPNPTQHSSTASNL
ncbi:hypothetical protein ACP275_04G224000 [Erythranthe tilingii]